MINRELLNKEISVQGSLKKIKDPYIVIKSAKFECPNCGAILSALQLDDKFREPSRCSCGWKSSFIVLEKELADQQDFLICVLRTQEELKVYLTSKELIEKFSKRKGSIIKVKGILKEEFKKNSNKGNFVIFAEELNSELK